MTDFFFLKSKKLLRFFYTVMKDTFLLQITIMRWNTKKGNYFILCKKKIIIINSAEKFLSPTTPITPNKSIRCSRLRILKLPISAYKRIHIRYTCISTALHINKMSVNERFKTYFKLKGTDWLENIRYK